MTLHRIYRIIFIISRRDRHFYFMCLTNQALSNLINSWLGSKLDWQFFKLEFSNVCKTRGTNIKFNVSTSQFQSFVPNHVLSIAPPSTANTFKQIFNITTSYDENVSQCLSKDRPFKCTMIPRDMLALIPWHRLLNGWSLFSRSFGSGFKYWERFLKLPLCNRSPS